MNRNHKLNLIRKIFIVLTLLFSAIEAKSAETNSKGFPSVTIGGKVWMVKNLDVDHYRNGDEIPQVQDPEAWSRLTTGAWCYYENDSEKGRTYGKLYNWFAVNDSRGPAPQGWHVASDDEWSQLVSATGGDRGSATSLKSKIQWNPPLVRADNRSRFTALPSGYRSNNGKFYLSGSNAGFWSSTEASESSAWYREMFNSYSAVYRVSISKTQGLAVRCVKD